MQYIRTYNSISPKGLALFPSSSYQTDAVVGEPDAIMLRSHNLHLEPIPKYVKAIARCGAGTNNIPVDECTGKGIVVFNTPGANANAVKELVIASMLMTCRHLLDASIYCNSLNTQQAKEAFKQQVEAGKKKFGGLELRGKTLGVIGLGAIGASVAHAALSLGMKVIGYDPVLSVDAAWRLSAEIERAEQLTSLLGRCDFVTVHVPANEKTRNLLNGDLLGQIKSNAVLLNFARDTIVDEQAVLQALQLGKLKYYVSDFPTPALAGQDNILLLPHLGASTDEAEELCACMAANQLMDFLENGNIKNSVNFPSIFLERSGGHRITFANKNIPGVLNDVLSLLSDMKINVLDMLNKSRQEVAYTIVDVEQLPSEQLLTTISQMEHVFHVCSYH